MVFTRWPREDSFPTSFPGLSPTRPCGATVRRENLEMRLYSFPVSRALGGKYRRLSRFAIFFYVHENAGFTREKNHSRARVSGNRCKFTLAKVSHTKKNLELFQVLCARTRTRVMFFNSDSFLKRDFLSPCSSWKALVSSHIPKRVDCFKLEEDQTMWYRR